MENICVNMNLQDQSRPPRRRQSSHFYFSEGLNTLKKKQFFLRKQHQDKVKISLFLMITFIPDYIHLSGGDNVRNLNWRPTWLSWGFPSGSSVKKKSACNRGDAGLIPMSGRSPVGGHSYPLQRTEEPGGL